MVLKRTTPSASKRNLLIKGHLTAGEVRLSTHLPPEIAATKLRPSSTGLHGVFHKRRVFDPTSLVEADAMPIISNQHLFALPTDYYDEIDYFYHTPMVFFTENIVTLQVINLKSNDKISILQ